MQEIIIGEPVELIDEDLDAVAGGEFNIANIEQEIEQFQLAIDNDGAVLQSASQTAVVVQNN